MSTNFCKALVEVCIKTRVAFCAAFFSALLVFAANSYAATPAPTDAILAGTYAFQFATSQEAYWSVSKTCGSGTSKYTAFASGTDAYDQIVHGTITFNGKGAATLSFTYENQFDETASDATITITCTGNGKWTATGAELIYYPPQNGTGTGTYSVSANGSATARLNVPNGSGGTEVVTLNMNLVAFTNTGVATTALIRVNDNINNKHAGTGIAIHQ